MIGTFLVNQTAAVRIYRLSDGVKQVTKDDYRAYEAEIIPGIELVAIDELRSCSLGDIKHLHQSRPGFARFRFRGDPGRFRMLRSVVAIYEIHRFDIPRPKALLGHQHFTRLLGILRQIVSGFSHSKPTLGIGAAGGGSAVIRRLIGELAEALGAPVASDGKGELFVRLARAPNQNAWEVLARLTEQPLSKRTWRAVDVPGALNGTVAYAMTQLGSPKAGERVLNLCAGTATIAIEHAFSARSALSLAIDNSPPMLEAAKLNLQSSRTAAQIQLLQADAVSVPLAAGTVDRLYADLPFGNHIGSHQDNVQLYPKLLREAARVATAWAEFVLLTHEITLLRKLLTASDWFIDSEIKINLAGLHPRLFVLKRKSNTI